MRREAHSAIPAIWDQLGTLHTSTVDINNTFKEFYENLYTSEPVAGKAESEAFLCDLSLPTLSTEQKHILDAPISTEEILKVIKTLPVGKAPGPDGFTDDFYKCFAHELVPLMLDMYVDSLKRGALPPTLSQAIITLIFKKGKESTDCRSYRPILLTNGRPGHFCLGFRTVGCCDSLKS